MTGNSRIPARAEMRHWWAVARRFRPWQHGFWLGLCHDTVEDGYLPRALLRVWPALDAITRREGEPYGVYIERVGAHPVARRVKIADLGINLARGEGDPVRTSLRKRYLAALDALVTIHEAGDDRAE